MMRRFPTYLFFNFIFGVSRTFNNTPEVNELIILDLTIVIVVNSVEELLRRNLSEKKLRPMLHCFILINSF